MRNGKQRMPNDTIGDLREALFTTLRAVRDGSMELDRARAVNELGKTLIDSARVEVDFIRATGADDGTGFIPSGPAALPDGITQIVRHRIR